MKINTIIFFVLATAFGLLSGMTAQLAHREFTAYRAETAWVISDFQDFSGNALALSHRANQYWINGCLRAITSIEGRLLYGENRTDLLASCGEVASDITTSSPRNSYAWFLQAYLAHQNGAEETFNTALLKSYEHGPTEQWVAELRVPLAERGHALLNTETRLGHQKDLALLVESRRGIGSIARRYVRDQDFRDRITYVVETMPQSAQQRFLGTLKHEVARFQNEE